MNAARCVLWMVVWIAADMAKTTLWAEAPFVFRAILCLIVALAAGLMAGAAYSVGKDDGADGR